MVFDHLLWKNAFELLLDVFLASNLVPVPNPVVDFCLGCFQIEFGEESFVLFFVDLANELFNDTFVLDEISFGDLVIVQSFLGVCW